MLSRSSSWRNVSSSTARASAAAAPSPPTALTPRLTFGPIHSSSCLDLVGEVGRVRVDHGGGEGAELRGEIDADRAELVADDPPGDAVPQRRYRHVPVESGFRRLVRIPQEREPVDGVRAVGGTECPPTRVAGTVDVGHGDHVLEAGERMGDRHPLCPGAEPAGVDVIAAGLGGVRRRAVVRDAALEAVQRPRVVRSLGDAVLPEALGVDGAGEGALLAEASEIEVLVEIMGVNLMCVVIGCSSRCRSMG